MCIHTYQFRLRLVPIKAGFTFVSLLPLFMVNQASALEFNLFDNQLFGTFDTPSSMASWRVQGQDKLNNDINRNDGNRNLGIGLVSEIYKITSDLEATWQNSGMFVRGMAFYDAQIMGKRNDYYRHNDPS